jgi:Uma2 family endonuclease
VSGRIRYPDAFVFCSPAPGHVTVIEDPVVVFEVLSPSTSRIDRIDKLSEYRATKSIQRYVILEPDSVAATARTGKDWIVRPLIVGDSLEMPEIEIVIPLSDIYSDVEFGPSAVDDPPDIV